MIIALSGVDCSGKSTQITRLSALFGHDRTKIVWGRYGYTPGVEALKKVYRLLRGHNNKNLNWVSVNSQSHFSLLKSIWRWISILDFLFYYSVLVRFADKHDKTIILDRFLVDFFVDYECYHNKKVGLILERLSKILLCKPKFSFLLNVEIDTSLDRMIKKNDPFPESKERLEKRRRLYEKYWFTGWIIDANRGVDEVFEDIRSYIQTKT